MYVLLEQHPQQYAVIKLQGDLNQQSAATLREAIEVIHTGQTQLVIDMEHLHSINSSGLRMLALVAYEAHRQHSKIVLIHVPPALRDILHRSRLDTFFDSGASVPEALLHCDQEELLALEIGK